MARRPEQRDSAQHPAIVRRDTYLADRTHGDHGNHGSDQGAYGRPVSHRPAHEQAGGVSPEMLELARQLQAVMHTRSAPTVIDATTTPGAGAGAGVGVHSARLAAQVEHTSRVRAGVRARRLPYVGAGVTAAAGYSAWGLGTLAAASAGVGGELLATTGTAGVCALALAVLRVTYRDRIVEAWRRRWWAAGTGASVWVTTATVAGAGSWPMTAALALGTAAASTRWLAAHDPTALPSTVPPVPVLDAPLPVLEAATEDQGQVLARRWAERIATGGGAIPSSLLTDRHDLPHAVRWTVQTVPGTTSFSAMFALVGRIASGLQVPAARILLEPSEVDESAAILTVITKDLLAAGVGYPGPHYDQGTVRIGPWADGSGWADYVAVDEVGARNGMASGDPGSGKTAFLEAVALGLKSSGCWVVWFGDGDPSGGSSPLLNEAADWAEAGPDRVLAQLEAVEAVLEVRSLLKTTLTGDPATGLPVPRTDAVTQRQVREIRPCPAFPGLQWILDELHRLTSDDTLKAANFAARLERVVRIGRKYGVVLLTGSQSLLAGDFGNRTPLRSYLGSRNLFAFRNGTKSERAVVSGLEISPSSLPKKPGYAYSAGSGRLAMTRVAWSPGMADWIPTLPTTHLDPDTTAAAAAHRPAAAPDPVAELAARHAQLATWRATHNPAPAAGQVPAGSAGAGTVTPLPPRPAARPAGALGGGMLAGLRPPGPLRIAPVIPIDRTTPPPAQEPAARESAARELAAGELAAGELAAARARDAGPDLDVLNNAQRCVHDALTARLTGARPGQTVRAGELVTATGLRPPAVSKALAALADLDLAHSPTYAEWALGPATTPSSSDTQTG